MKKTIAALLMTSAFAASVVWGQAPAPTPRTAPDPAKLAQRRVDRLTAFLTLTTDQQTQAKTLYTAAASSAASLQSGLRTARRALINAERNNDTATIDQESSTIGTLTGQLTSLESRTEAAFNQMLTPDQQTKYTQLKGMGPGMFGGRGGPGPRGPRN
jgi:Spy/CpxP family protein refolding chaperone